MGNTNEIKKFNVKINGQSGQTFDVGANAKHVYFSETATDPFKNKPIDDNVSKALSEKAQNNIYGNAFIRNNTPNIVNGVGDDAAKNGQDYADKSSYGSGAFTISYGLGSVATGHNASAIGFDCEAKGWASHAEGWKTVTENSSNYSHAEGGYTLAGHNMAHAEGDGTQAVGWASHAEGMGGRRNESLSIPGGGAQGVASHTEGVGNTVFAQNGIKTNPMYELDNPFGYRNGAASHAEGIGNIINGGVACHVSGIENTIENVYTGAIIAGKKNTINASADYCLIAGQENTIQASCNHSVVFGYKNDLQANNGECLVIGRYCAIGSSEAEKPAFIIGGGDSTTKSNLMTIRYPSNGGAASSTNRGNLWGGNLEAHFGVLHANSTNITNNKWVHVGWDFGSAAYSKNYAEGTEGFDLPHAALSIWINEEDKLLYMLFCPFRNGGSWNKHDVSTLRGFNAGTNKDGRVPYAGNYTSADNSAAPQKIVDAIKNIKTSIRSDVFVNTSYNALACTFNPRKLFAVNGNIQNGYFYIRSLTPDFSGLKDSQKTIQQKFDSIKHVALAGDPSFTFLFPYD